MRESSPESRAIDGIQHGRTELGEGDGGGHAGGVGAFAGEDGPGAPFGPQPERGVVRGGDTARADLERPAEGYAAAVGDRGLSDGGETGAGGRAGGLCTDKGDARHIIGLCQSADGQRQSAREHKVQPGQSA